MSALSHASRTGRRGGFASQSGSTRAESPSRPWRDAPAPQRGLNPLRLRSIAPVGSRSLRLRSRPRDERSAAGAPQIARARAGLGRRNVPPAPFAGPGLSPRRAGRFGINSPPRPPRLTSPPPSGSAWLPSLCGDARYGFRCTESPCPLRGGAAPRLSALPPGPCRAAPKSLPARTTKRHAAPESLLPSAGRAIRHSRAKAKRVSEC